MPSARSGASMITARSEDADRAERAGASMPEARTEHADRGHGSDQADAALQSARGDGSGRKLIVFDFDRTIMKEHMWNKYKSTPISKIRITDEDFVDIGKFRGLVLALRKNGHNAAVATFGRRDVVDKALHHALGEPHGISVRTPADFGHKDGSGQLGDKNTQLAELAQRYCVSADQIIFLDDDPYNIDAAARAGVVHSQWVPDGLTKNDVMRVAEQVGVRPLSANEATRQITARKAKAVPKAKYGRRDTGPIIDIREELEKQLNISDDAEGQGNTEPDVRPDWAKPSAVSSAAPHAAEVSGSALQESPTARRSPMPLQLRKGAREQTASASH